MIISGILFTGLMCIRSFATSKREDFAVCSTMAERDASSTIFYDVGNSFMRYDSPLVCPRVHNTHKYRVAQKSKLLYCVNSLLFFEPPYKVGLRRTTTVRTLYSQLKCLMWSFHNELWCIVPLLFCRCLIFQTKKTRWNSFLRHSLVDLIWLIKAAL